jgi:DNA polymerase-3 subunit delta
VHFKQKNAIGLQCRMWSTPRLAQALARANQAAKAARLTSSLEDAITEELLIALAGAARPAVGRA